ncbi:MAG: hypothetical protein HZC55_04035 [Verrucomicrobia bacterium]|nr:hypothetical protein [Verrucomicrobiota bacterium]
MKSILAYLALAAALVAAEPVVSVDLYGNVFLDGQNTNQQIADFARNNPTLAPQVDGAVRDAALAARKHIADAVKAAQDQAAAQIAAKAAEAQALVTANATELQTKTTQLATATARVAALEVHVAALGTYIAALRGTLAGLGGTSAAPPAAPNP